MRQAAYIIAALAAVGIMIAIAVVPGGSDSESSPIAEEAQVMSAAGSVRLDVPDMHCSFSCFPSVKETLEGQEGVEEVQLAEQKEEGVLDNRQVIVKYEPGFNLTYAMSDLKKSGFESKVAN